MECREEAVPARRAGRGVGAVGDRQGGQVAGHALGVTVGSMIVNHGGEVSPISVPSGVYGITMYGMCVAFMLWRRNRAEAGRPAAA